MEGGLGDSILSTDLGSSKEVVPNPQVPLKLYSSERKVIPANTQGKEHNEGGRSEPRPEQLETASTAGLGGGSRSSGVGSYSLILEVK